MEKRTRKPIHLFLLCSLIALVGGLGLVGLAMADVEDLVIQPDKTGDRELQRLRPTASGNQALGVPVNDECSGALVIADGPYPICSPITTDVLLATPAPADTPGTDPDDGCYAGPANGAANTVWYTWTPAGDAYYNLTLCHGTSCPADGTSTTDDDSIFTIYTAADCSGPFTAVDCDDDGCGGTGVPSKIGPLFLTGGVTYYIAVGNWTNLALAGLVDTAEIRIALAEPPANDVCSGAEVLMLNMPLDGASNSLANDNYQAPAGCFSNVALPAVNPVTTTSGRDVTYVFTAPAAGSYSINLKAYNSGATVAANAVLYLATDCSADGEVGGCITAANRTTAGSGASSGFGGNESTSCVTLADGQTVYAIVDASAATADEVGFEIEATTCREELEPNGTQAQADMVDTDGDGTPDAANSPYLGCPIDGRIFTIPSVFTDVDYYALGAQTDGARLFAAAECAMGQVIVNSPTSTLIDMRLTNLADTLEFDDADLTSQNGNACPAISGAQLLGGGNKYLRINHATAASAWEPYRLHTIVREPGTQYPEPAEPHGSIFGKDFISGRIDAPADLDRHWICARKGDQVMINVDTDPERDGTSTSFAMFAYDAFGAQWPSPPGSGFLFGAGTVLTPGTGNLTSNTPRATGPALTGMAAVSGPLRINVDEVCQYLAPGCSGLLNTLGTYNMQVSLNCNEVTADLSVTKSGDALVEAGGLVTYTITVSNSGSNPAFFAGIYDVLPPGAIPVGFTAPPEWDCYQAAVDAVECDELTACFDGTAEITLTVFIPYCSGDTTIENYVEAFSFTPDSDPSNDTDNWLTSVNDEGCDDGNPCTEDLCDPVEGCYHVPSTGSACDDSNVCTSGDTCFEGACVGTPNTDPCNDGNACTTNDTCAGGVCEGGAPLNCNDGNNCTDDSCDPGTGCVNDCNHSCDGQMKGYGWWKRLCRGPHPSGEFLSGVDVDCVNNTCPFGSVASVADICDRLTPNPHNDKCEQAEAQLMTLLLNNCRCRTGHHQPIDATCGPGTTVGQAIADASARLCDPDRDHQSCILAHCSSESINSGAALWSNSLRLVRVNATTTQLTWQPPYASPDGSNLNVRTYRIWARGDNETAFTLVGEVSGSTMSFVHTNGSANSFYEVTSTW